MNAYNIDWWGNKYFGVNSKGHVVVHPNPNETDTEVDLADLVKERAKLVSLRFYRTDCLI